MLKDVTKEDVLNLFMAKVHPSSKTRSKLSVHMKSKKPRLPRVSEEASRVFTALVREKMPDLDENAWKDLGEGVHTLADFQSHWAQALEGRDVSELMAAFPAIMEKHPVEGEGVDKKREGVEYIDDLAAFRKTLQPAPLVGALVEWGDMPAPRL